MPWVGRGAHSVHTAFGAATEPQPLAVIDPLVLVATDNLPMPGAAVLLRGLTTWCSELSS